MSGKRAHINIDPDYEDVTDQQNKRQRVLEKDAKHAAVKKIEGIVKTQFGIEIQNKEHEVNLIDQRLCEARLMIDRLRACITANFYSTADQQRFLLKSNSAQPAIHPAVKSHLGKTLSHTQTSSQDSSSTSSSTQLTVKPTIVAETPTVSTSSLLSSSTATASSSTQHELRDSRFKIKKRIVVGNVTKYIPVEKREANDQSTHKWMVYVRGSKDSPRIDGFVKKIWFFLHPSYRPNDLVEICQPPFHLTRRGWGEFPIRVQIHFADSRNKKVDIIHHLKLDRTYTGLQTLGSETVVDVELERECKEVSVPRPVNESLMNHPHGISDQSETVSNDEHHLSKEQNSIIENGTCHTKDINHTIVHSPIKPKTLIKRSSVGGEEEQNQHVNMDSKLNSVKPSVKTEGLSTVNNIKPPANQTFYLKCKDSKGNILLVPKMVVNSNGQSASQQQMTTFRVTPPTSTTTNMTNNRTVSGQLLTKPSGQSGMRSLLAHPNSQNCNPVKTNTASLKPSVQLMVTSKGLQLLPQSQNINSTAKTNPTVKSQSLLELNQTKKLQSLLKPNHTVKSQQLKLNATTAPNVNSSKPVSLLLNSVNQPVFGTPKLQLTAGGFKTNLNQPKVNTVPLLVQNKNQKSLLRNSVAASPNNLMTNTSSKITPSVVLANVGSKTFLLQVHSDNPINKSQNMSVPKQTLKTQADHVKSNSFVPNTNILNKVQVVQHPNLNVRQHPVDRKEQENVLNNSEMEPEKRTHVWKKKKLEEEFIEPLKLDDHNDVLSLIKAAVKRHPLVREKVDRNTHPYCAYSHQQWLNWNIGKKRASEWQRASWVRKFIVENLKGETVFKGKQLWSTKQIMYWCRLHAFSPHYMESNSEATTNKTTIENSRSELVNSLTDVNQIIQQLPQQPSLSDSSDEEIDIVNVDLRTKIKKEIKEEKDETYQNLSNEEILHIPPSQQAQYIQDTCQKIGVKLKPVDLDDNVFGSACEEMIFAAMKSFAEDLLRESFAQKEVHKSNDTIHVEDVQQALVNSPTADFLTNAHLGIKHTDIFPSLR